MMRILLVLVILLSFICNYVLLQELKCKQHYSTTSKGIGLKKGTNNKIGYSVENHFCNKSFSNGKHVSPSVITNTSWYVNKLREKDRWPSILFYLEWRPTQDGSITDLEGFRLTFVRNKQEVQSAVVIYVCLDTKLDFDSHALAKYEYKCYGMMNATKILPGDVIKVVVDPIPLSYQNIIPATYTLAIPDCNNSKMKLTKLCYLEKQSTFSIDSIICIERAMILTYSLPVECGKTVTLIMCPIQESSTDNCFPNATVLKQPLSGTIKLFLPHLSFTSVNFTIFVKVNGVGTIHTSTRFGFQSCQRQNFSPIAIALVVSATLLAIALVVVIVYIVKRCWLITNKTQSSNDSSCPSDTSSVSEEAIPPQSLISHSIYLLFVSDHPLHKQVVLSFEKFLTEDLSFNVISELHDQATQAPSYAEWMMDTFKEADRVLVIWSYGSAMRWISAQEDCKISQYDKFTPVLKLIRNDILIDKNLGKYFFCYFDYFDKDNIPDVFKNLPCYHFKLMKQFEDLYFQLKDMEKYSRGIVVHNPNIADYSNIKLNKNGQLLKQSIEAMCDHVKMNKNWYTDYNGGDIAGGGNADEMINEVLRWKIDIVPPPLDDQFNLPDSGFAENSHLLSKPLDLDADPHEVLFSINCETNYA